MQGLTIDGKQLYYDEVGEREDGVTVLVYSRRIVGYELVGKNYQELKVVDGGRNLATFIYKEVEEEPEVEEEVIDEITQDNDDTKNSLNRIRDLIGNLVGGGNREEQGQDIAEVSDAVDNELDITMDDGDSQVNISVEQNSGEVVEVDNALDKSSDNNDDMD